MNRFHSEKPARTGETGVLAEPPPPQRNLASMPRTQRDGSPRGTERKPESALFSPSPVVGQEQPPPVRTHLPETESSESDASDEPGPKEDPSHLGARPASDLEGDPEEEAGEAEPPSAQLELAILNGLDISSLPALRDLSTRASTTVYIPWPPVGMERATPEWRRKASQAMAFLLGGRGGEHYGSWSGALRQRPECRLDAPDITTDGGMWTARMHNSTVCWVLDGLVSARATGHREPEGMNEILRDIAPRRGVLPVPGPARGSPRADGTFPERGIEERRSQNQASPWNHLLPRYKNRVGDGGSPDPERWEGRLNHSFRLSRESAAKQNRVGDGGSPGPGRWEGRLNHSSRLNREPAAKQISPG